MKPYNNQEARRVHELSQLSDMLANQVKPSNSPTLADYNIPIPSCTGCTEELPQTARVEVYGRWIIAQCPKCRVMTPFKSEKSA